MEPVSSCRESHPGTEIWGQWSSSRDEPAGISASYLTHELRAPVASTRLGLEILLEQVQERLSADERKLLDSAIRNVGRLGILIDDILDYSKIMAGKLRLERKPCNCRELMEEALESMQALAIARGIRLVREAGEPLGPIWADRRRIVQVLTNLISNAVKFSPPRSLVSVSVRKGQNGNAGTLVFRVKDGGCGIPPEDLERIFELFAQPRNQGAQAGDGTGIGLTLAQLMVEMHGGKIWAESWKGVGSVFSFSLPTAPKPQLETRAERLLAILGRGLRSLLAAFA
jgi:signal transduction histidine kinase